MSEKEATEDAINRKLEEIMERKEIEGHEEISHTFKFLAKILFNVRFDLDEFKIHVLEMLKGVETEADPELEELKFPPEIDLDIKRLKNDFYS